MKKILFLFFLLSSIVVNAQTDIMDIQINEGKDFYCTISSYRTATSNTTLCNATIDFGQESSYISDNGRFFLCDNNNNRMSFGSAIQILNYMIGKGWNYIEQVEKETFLLKKNVIRKEDIFEGLNIQKGLKKNKN